MVFDYFENFSGFTAEDAIDFIEKYNDFQIENNKNEKNNIIQIDRNNNIIDKNEKQNINDEDVNDKHTKNINDKLENIKNDSRWYDEYINSSQINGARLTGNKFPKRLDGKWICDNGKTNEYIGLDNIKNKQLFIKNEDVSTKDLKNAKMYYGIIKAFFSNYKNYESFKNLCGDPFIKEEKNGMKLKKINECIHNKELFKKCNTANRITNPLKRFWSIINDVY